MGPSYMLRKILLIVAVCASTLAYSSDLALPVPDALQPAHPKYKFRSPKITKLNLTLADAIALALRHNPSVEDARLSTAVDKFSQKVLRNQFMPQYSFQATSTFTQNEKAEYTITPTTSLETPLGTNVSVGYNNDLSGKGGNLNLNLTQPLLKGFGLAKLQAEDTAASLWGNKLSYRNTIEETIVTIISDYRAIVEQEKGLEVQKKTYKAELVSLNNLKLQVKAGRKARSDIIQQQSSIASMQLNITSQEQDLFEAKQQFLITLGINPNSNIKIKDDSDYNISDAFPTKAHAEYMALRNNIAYRQALLAVSNAERSYKEAKNNTRWDLELTAQDQENVAATSKDPFPADGRSVGLSLSIPIHNLDNKQSVLEAKVAVQKAKLDLRAARDNTITTVDTEISQLRLQLKQIQQAKTAIALGEQNLENYIIQYKYNKTSQYILDQNRNNLLLQQLTLIEAQISYLNQLTQLRQFTGTILPYWHIKLRGVLGE